MMRKELIATFSTLVIGIALAGDSVSPAFTFDARYERSGQSIADFATTEAVALTDRFSLRTVALVVDANGNGIPDAWETLYGLSGESALADADPDGDGVCNLDEYNAGTNPVVAEDFSLATAVSESHVVNTWYESSGLGFPELIEVFARSGLFTTDTVGRAPDTDKDGMPDWWERLFGLDPLVNDAHADPDSDGRTNLEEYNAGTNPTVAEDWSLATAVNSDAFVTDTRVVYTGGRPSFDEGFAVYRVSDCFVCDTGGLYYDWDADGIPNWWEKRFSRDGSKTGLAADADDDGDGLNNYGEFVAYTDPTNAASRFALALARVEVVPVQASATVRLRTANAAADGAGTAGFCLRWPSAKGRVYTVFVRESLTDDWVSAAELTGTDGELEYLPDTTAATQFFKVTVRLDDSWLGR